MLTKLLDVHAPLKSKTVTLHPQQPWYTSEIAEAKKLRRKAEQKWRRAKLTIDREIFISHKKTVKRLIAVAKSSYYSNKISEAENSKTLFKIVDSLLTTSANTNLPTSDSNADLANDFATFFSNKIETIRTQLSAMNKSKPEEVVTESHLHSFEPASEEEVKKVIMGSKSTSCSIDPIPTFLLKSSIDVLAPIVTKIVNLSLQHAYMPAELKQAIILPLLKKVCLDKEIFKNYRPISNLAFISKVIERVVAARIKDHMDNNMLHEILQSAYKSLHSIETALVKVQDDVLYALDHNKGVLLVLLDLSAAFDTVDHEILLNRVERRLGISGSALAWLRSYLEGRKQSVKIDSDSSDPWELLFGVPQGSVLGPILFTIYTLPVADILKKHDIMYHCYADDTQIYLSCSLDDLGAAKKKMEQCIAEIRSWMASNYLRLNDDKTEIVFIGRKSLVSKVGTVSLEIGDSVIQSSTKARNIGMIVDNVLNLKSHINQMCKGAWFHLRNIGMIKQFLSKETCEKLIHAFVTAKLDFLNSLIYGLPDLDINKLQRIQNAAARMLTGAKMRDHIQPILRELHWLPLKFRIDYKLLLLTFKALNGLAPSYISELLKPVSIGRSLRSVTRQDLHIPRTRSTFGDRRFSVVAPKLWNTLPSDMKDITCVDAFKKSLKTFLFGKAFP